MRTDAEEAGLAAQLTYDDAGGLTQATLSMARTGGAGAAITSHFRAAETCSAYSPWDTPTLPSLAYS